MKKNIMLTMAVLNIVLLSNTTLPASASERKIKALSGQLLSTDRSGRFTARNIINLLDCIKIRGTGARLATSARKWIANVWKPV